MIWQGRFDGEDPLYHRIFQRVSLETDYTSISPNDFVLHGFAVDEGVKRNKGRVGAKEAPDIIRKNMSNFPVISPEFSLKDFGNITCENGNLEGAQNELAEKVAEVLKKSGKSIVLGGGHEVTFAHYSGIRKAFPQVVHGQWRRMQHIIGIKPVIAQLVHHNFESRKITGKRKLFHQFIDSQMKRTFAYGILTGAVFPVTNGAYRENYLQIRDLLTQLQHNFR